LIARSQSRDLYGSVGSVENRSQSDERFRGSSSVEKVG